MNSLVHEIAAFLRATRMAECTFGRAAVKDPRFVGDLRNGRAPRRATEAKVRSFMATYQPAQQGKAA